MADREFGHIVHVGKLDGYAVRCDTWGAGPFLLTVAGRQHRFEDSDRFGPLRVRKDGSIPSDPWWPERHPFWVAHRCWVRQGRRLESDGVTCIWAPPKPTVVRHLGGRNFMMIEDGDEDGDLVDELGHPVRRAKRSPVNERS